MSIADKGQSAVLGEAYGRHCRNARDLRGLRSGQSFIDEARQTAARATWKGAA